jgi:hypothetical protein
MYYKEVSDLDYGYNKETGNYDLPSVEWSTDMGRFWESFATEELRTKALEENEAYNNQPEVKAFIEAERKAEDIGYATRWSAELFEYCMEKSQTVALKDVISFVGCFNKTTVEVLTKLTCQHNKLIMRARVQPVPATFTIGDLF